MILFADCFDNYATANIEDVYTQIYGLGDTQTPIIGAYGRRGTDGLLFTSNVAAGQPGPVGIVLPNVEDTLGFGVAGLFTGNFNSLTTIPNTSGYSSMTPGRVVGNQFTGVSIACLALFRSFSLTAIGLAINQNGTISACRGSGQNSAFDHDFVAEVLGTTTFALQIGTYYYIEAKVVSGATGSVEIRVNGTVWLLVTSVNTQPVNTFGYCDELVLGMMTAPTVGGIAFAIDDFVIWNTDASDPLNDIVDFLGDVELNYCPPIADVVAEWTPLTGTEHFAMVNEIPPDDDGSYNSTDVTNAVDTFQPSCVLPDGSAVTFVTVVYDRKRPSGGNTSTCPVWRIGGTNYLRDAQGDPSTYAYWQGTWTKDPSTSGGITGATFNAASFGYKKVS